MFAPRIVFFAVLMATTYHMVTCAAYSYLDVDPQSYMSYKRLNDLSYKRQNNLSKKGQNENSMYGMRIDAGSYLLGNQENAGNRTSLASTSTPIPKRAYEPIAKFPQRDFMVCFPIEN